MRRTFDYEPFIREFVTSLQHEGWLEEALKGPSGLPAETGDAASPKKTKAKGKTRKK